MTQSLTLGVEEEFFAVDPISRELLTDGRPILDLLHRRSAGDHDPSYSHELRLCMVESRTGICHGLDQVRSEIRRLRAGLIQAAAETGSAVAAAGTLPLAHWETQCITPNPRYEHMANAFARMASEHVICACHVHVGIDDRELAVQVLNRARPWMPVLLALSTSSPFWMGKETGYASYRSIVWERWPMAGMPPLFHSYPDYKARVDSLIGTRMIFDAGQVFWDVRLGTKHETLEFRIADSCTTIDETIMQAGLCRALVQVCLNEVAEGNHSPDIRPELLRAAKWRSARFGLDDCLLDPVSAEV
ncbi:MAG: carboxylate-amine ligase, partial [Actinomycetota bacterium]